MGYIPYPVYINRQSDTFLRCVFIGAISNILIVYYPHISQTQSMQYSACQPAELVTYWPSNNIILTNLSNMVFNELSSCKKLLVISQGVSTWCWPDHLQNFSPDSSQICHPDRIHFRKITHVNNSSAWILQSNTQSSLRFCHEETSIALLNCYYLTIWCPYSHSRCRVNLFKML